MRKQEHFNKIICVVVFVLIAETISACSANTSTRELLAKCQLPDGSAMVRLYNRNGSHATTSDSSIITYQEPNAKEITIFSAYSSPAIKNIDCEQNQIALIEYANDQPTFILAYDWIKNELTQKPLTFYKLTLTSPEYKEKVADWEGITIP